MSHARPFTQTESPYAVAHLPPAPVRKDYRIGVVGSGFIVRDVQLVAYKRAGYTVSGITSASLQQATEVAAAHGIPHVHTDLEQMLASGECDVLDIAVPPHVQPDVLRRVVRSKGSLKGVLAQKPLAMDHKQARELVELCSGAGLTLAVNQNMRFDQSMRALKSLLDRGDLGEPVLGTIEMRAIPHWQPWAVDYGKLTLLVMSIHHLDVFRYLFGDPDSIYVSARPDPRTKFPHTDGVTLYILEYANGFRASGWDDVWTGPSREGSGANIYIRWRVEGTDGLAEGTIGWPDYPNATPSTIRWTSKRTGNCWVAPSWNEVWFPDAFAGPMGELFNSLAEEREPAISGKDNLRTMALVDAAYKSLADHRPVFVKEILDQ